MTSCSSVDTGEHQVDDLSRNDALQLNRSLNSLSPHRYMFASTEKARLQEIGPRFTLKLRWLRKGLPSVLAADGVAPRSGDKAESEDDEDAEEDGEDVDVDMERTDKPTVANEGEDEDEDEDEAEETKGKKRKDMVNGVKIPALDEEQEYEWKWKVSRLPAAIWDSLEANSGPFLFRP